MHWRIERSGCDALVGLLRKLLAALEGHQEG